jgi:hypothetical protein
MKIEVEKTLIEKAIEHLEIAQKESFAYETDFIINDLKKEIDRKKINRNLLLEFYRHLCNKKDVLPINSFSCEREVDSFIKSKYEEEK